MRKTAHAITMLLLLTICINAGSQTIENPYYEFKTSGIYSITEIQLTKTATYITIHSDFIPNWWVMFADDIVITDTDTGIEYKVQDIKGAEFNEQLWMPDSGDSTVVLVFPPLPATVSKIDYHTYIFSISLREEKAGVKPPATILPEVEKWIDSELQKSTAQPLTDFQSADFFNDTPARLIGCIKGYNPRAGFSTGLIYAGNDFTREDFPVVAQIKPDGRFEVEIPLNKPAQSYIVYNNQWLIPFYIEPGQTLAMIIDWDEMLIADRKRNVRYQFSDIVFKGALASLNHDLMKIPADDYNHESFVEKLTTLTPLEFKKDNEEQLAEKLEQLENFLAENQFSEKAQTIMRSTEIVRSATRFFDYEMYRWHYASQDTANKVLKIPIPDSYYSFLQQIDLNDQSLLVASDFKVFINRFEYCTPFSKVHSIFSQNNQPRFGAEKTLLDFFIEDGVELTEEELKYLQLAVKNELTDEEMKFLKSNNHLSEQFAEKHKDLIQAWKDQYLIPLIRPNNNNREVELWKLRDSILIHDLGLQNNLAYEIAKIRSLQQSFKNADSKEYAVELWDFLQQGISNPYLVQTGYRIFKQLFPEEEIASVPLPKGIGTDVFMGIIGPHKGKLLFVDFWATTCAPCIHSIRNMKQVRGKYAGNPDFDFVFITDVRSSPENNYNDFVKEQELANTYRIPQDDFNYLRQLFKFNGIPRYVVIDRKGHIINDNFNMHNFEHELAKLLPKK